jgi:hypothetical protein
MSKALITIFLASSIVFAGVIVELTAVHSGGIPYPQIWQGQVEDTVEIVIPDSVTKIWVRGNEVQVCVEGDSIMCVWSASMRTVHIGAE